MENRCSLQKKLISAGRGAGDAFKTIRRLFLVKRVKFGIQLSKKRRRIIPLKPHPKPGGRGTVFCKVAWSCRRTLPSRSAMAAMSRSQRCSFSIACWRRRVRCAAASCEGCAGLSKRNQVELRRRTDTHAMCSCQENDF